jgi:hypothetical protein
MTARLSSMDRSQSNSSSEIPCRVIQSELPGSEVIPDGKPANNGEALLVCGAQGRHHSERVISWEVGSMASLAGELDPVTTECQ